MIRLICIDVDGTLIGTSGEVHEEVWSAARAARARGMRIGLCSGRPGFGKTRAYARLLDDTGWHVFQNGASVLSLSADAASRSTALPPTQIGKLVARARELGRTLELYTDTTYAVERDSGPARDHARILGLPFEARSFAELEGTVVRAQWLLEAHEERLEREERASFSGLEVAASTSPMMPGVLFVNMTAEGTHKGAAVRSVADAYGIPLDDVMFVGDGDNDVPALRVVGHPVAMGNAEDGAKAAARHHVGHVDALGLVEAFDVAMASW